MPLARQARHFLAFIHAPRILEARCSQVAKSKSYVPLSSSFSI